MASHYTLSRFITATSAIVWAVNGLLCKVLVLVPRHRQIVAAILGERYAVLLTTAIGVAEMFMAVWIISGVWRRASAVVQIMLVATMNIIEAAVTPDLLLFGYWNAAFAAGFIGLIWFNEFVLRKNNLTRQYGVLSKQSSI